MRHGAGDAIYGLLRHRVDSFFHQQLSMLTKWLVHASFSLSAVGMAISVISAYKTKNQNSVIAPLMVSLGLVLTCLGFILVAFHQVMNWQQIPDYFYVFILLSALLAIGCNINLVSMHGFYRNRLRDAFMPYQLPQDSGHVPSEISTWHASQMCYLKDLPITDAPFHIINCNVELTGSTQSKYRNRTGDCFSFTPLYSGATATGYRGTDVYLDGKVDLASVCAISGAAVATNTAATRSKPVNFLMAILNLRLGCWLKIQKLFIKADSFDHCGIARCLKTCLAVTWMKMKLSFTYRMVVILKTSAYTS